MKALLVVVGLLAVVVVAFVAFVRFGASQGSEPTTLTEQVGAAVVDAEPERDARSTNVTGHRVTYTYEVGGRSFTGDSWVPDDVWAPPTSTVQICVDPDDPALHAAPTMRGAECDGGNLGLNDEQRAEPS